MKTPTMKPIWECIHTWLITNAPKGYGNLRSGASEKAIQAAENTMGLKLPHDIRASIRIHDGQSMEPGLIGGEGWRLLSLQEIVEVWGHRSRANPKDAHHVPIAWIGTGDHVFLNLDPDSANRGWLMIQRRDSADPAPLAPSFSRWLEEFADDLKDGVFMYSKDEGEIMLADEMELD